MSQTRTATAPLSASLPDTAPAAARVVFSLMTGLADGALDVQLPDGSLVLCGLRADEGPRAAIRLHNWNVCAASLKAGDIGFAESFIAGDWSTPDLTALLRLFLANRERIETVVYGSWWGSLLYRIKHLVNRNSRAGSKKNIHAHYDLGNQFYRLWLDETMNYSSAWFDGNRAQDLPAAQRAKVRRTLQEVALQPGQRLLEIGCGWGALAECAAAEFGVRPTGVTLSAEQLAYARHRLQSAGLAADLRFQDYRDIDDGPYDAIVSIEMFEAVGREYWPAFFAKVAQQLETGGRACIQSITIRDDLFERYVRSTDFIQQYIFPGGLLPSPERFRAAAAHAGLRVTQELAFGEDYAETLRRWRDTFLARDAAVRRLGFDVRFQRIWEIYLAYCEAAFASGSTNVMQFTLVKD